MNSVLIMEKESSERPVLTRGLSEQGYRVYTAENEEEAMYLCDGVNPGVVIIDLSMPDTDGLTIIAKLSARLSADVPILALSQYKDGLVKDHALRMGASFFFVKPVELDTLNDFIRGLLCFNGESPPVHSDAGTAVLKGEGWVAWSS